LKSPILSALKSHQLVGSHCALYCIMLPLFPDSVNLMGEMESYVPLKKKKSC